MANSQEFTNLPAPPPTTVQQAWLEVKPRWQTLALTLTGLTWGTLVPGIAFCGWLPASQYTSMIAVTLLAIGIACLLAGRYMMRQSISNRHIDDFNISGILIVTAAALMAHVAIQSGPLRERTIEFWPALVISLLALIACITIMARRAQQLCDTDPNDS